jgi:hypothetical protein
MAQDALESRRKIVELISRAMFGPTGPDDSNWLGNDSRTNILSDGQVYEIESNYLQGPWFNPTGEEVLPDKYAPIKLYSVGLLFPEAPLLASQVEFPQEVDLENSPIDDVIDNKNFLESVESSSELDDSDVPLESTFRPRSFAVSLRTSTIQQTIKVVLQGGIYKRISIKRLGVNEQWWERQSSECELEFVSENQIHKVNLKGLELAIGIETTQQKDGSKICTVWVRNDTLCEDPSRLSEYTLFQTKLKIYVDRVLEYEIKNGSNPDSLSLLYSERVRRSVGHGCDSKETFLESESRWLIESESFPVFELKSTSPDISDDGKKYSISMYGLGTWHPEAISEVDRVLVNYEKWINNLNFKKVDIPNHYTDIADDHIAQCKRFLSRMTSGWARIKHDEQIRKTFMDASLAMANQRASANIPSRKIIVGDGGEILIDGSELERNNRTLTGKWRPFQIAFMLANIDNSIDQSPDVKPLIDVIWMPTGGGKTEAYLGLAAFTILWERRKAPELDKALMQKSYTKVLMRYTLRLLTSQQVSRAASLICALEMIRRENQMVYGKIPVRIGAWLGSATTPNTREQALEKYRNYLQDPVGTTGFLLNKCPWCSTKLGEVLENRISGYVKESLRNNLKLTRLKAKCENSKCNFFDELPIFEVDEDIYQSPPDFLVGTIDKFARLAWLYEPKMPKDITSAQRIFGLTNGQRTMPAPRLFIQDELHLISGPLGSIDALYEATLEALCMKDGEYPGRSPFIIASTATTKNFQSQLHSLYGRAGQLVPPPGLSIEDSFFARVETEKPGKLYVGVCAGGNSGFLRNQGKVLALLGHAAAVLENTGAISDPWWSNVAFFSSRRSLGQLDSLVETDLKSALYQIRNLSGVSSARIDADGKQLSSRQMRNKKQLTAISSDDVGAVLENLNIENTEENCIDLCFATSMIEVGLDVPRLGLMTIIGQPKSSSQYIQVSGRVGRSEASPGLVISLLNPNVYRDRSHYENFNNWHNKLYSSVEPASVTPFTKRSLHRTLGSVLTILLRVLSNSNKVRESIELNWDNAFAAIYMRAKQFDERSVKNLEDVAAELLAKAKAQVNENAQWNSSDKSNQFIFDPGDVLEKDKILTSWKVLNSMRSVDSDAGVQFSAEVFGRSLKKKNSVMEIELDEL